jgi:alpha-ketoglutaric semialdehyde dehydrogenase
MPVTGRLIVGFQTLTTGSSFRARSPASGIALDPPIFIAGPSEIDRTCRLAESAFDSFRQLPLEVRATFLEAAAKNLLDLGDELLERASQETGLPRARLESERGRTIGQLRLFAEVIRQGDFLGLRIDHALPHRKPLPRADLRLRKIPLGPVAVFGASNFPLAFSAAGGDVASALAAGCPVVVKAHPAHPGTSELAASAVSAAAKECGLPDGTYSHLSGPANDLGAALVSHSAIKAVGFTGSRGAGLALVKIAAQRAEPIPVYAEMSSINPVVILPGALRARHANIASGFVNSLTLGAGQFCTNPGLVLALQGPECEAFMMATAQALTATGGAQMLSAGIHRNYNFGVKRLEAHKAVSLVARGVAATGTEARCAFFTAPAQDFLNHPELGEEVFGPSAIVVVCRDLAELHQVLHSIEGQLTATLHLEAEDHALAAALLPALELRAGRIIVNGWPTGVEVSPAMVHGGPYPATSDSRSTSVGTLAIERFLRPVCYQDFPADLLPDELKAAQQRYRRLIDGAFVSAEKAR